MRYGALAFGLLLLALAPAKAQQVTGIEIIDPGIYSVHVTSSQPNANGIPANTSDSEQLEFRATKVPMQKGVHFGFRYHLTGTPDGAVVPIRKVILFPPQGLTPPGKPTVRQIERTLDRKIGETSYTDYSLDDPFELVPGQWTFQLWSGNRKLAEQSFTVVAR
ncbi:MAG TPA: DUF3859 domain-containing protein [Reyranella sp.]|jgi:hypothetical protein|nr:DUF3859 domain-containing protein [Reyranella sp.]